MKTKLNFKMLKVSIATLVLLFSLFNSAIAQPPAPAWVTFTPTGTTTGTATWDNSAEGSGAGYWYVLISTDPTFSDWGAGDGGYAPLSSYDFTGLTPNTTYYVFVSSVETGGWSWNSPTRSIISATQPLIVYYNKTSGASSLETVSNWGTNSDGSGTSPNNFTDDNQIFVINNGTAVTIGADWTVTGTNSKVILGDLTVNAIGFTIPSGYAFSGTIDIAGASSVSNTLTIQNTTIPTLGNLDAGSTVDYNGSDQTIATVTYPNLSLSGSGTKTFTDATVSKSLSISSEVVADLGSGLSHSALYLYLNGILQSSGTWGATGSGAANINDTYFAGTGIIDVPCIVNIPDANFKAALLAIPDLDANSDGEIQCSEATAYIGAINISSLGISDLTGIEAFTKITDLYCNDNSLTSLDVSTNTALNYLYCNNNLLTTLDVSGLTSLYEIDCYVNHLPTLDVSSNTALQYLYCNNNLLTILDISGLTSLYEIDCYENQLPSLDVSANTALYALECYNNQLTSLNVQNGNNGNIYDFDATNNPDLYCIQVDDPGDGSTDSWAIDGIASFNEFCGWSTVNIPDANFKAKLVGNDAIDNNPADDEIQYDEASAYTGTIDVSSQVISDLTGIEAFTNITSLNCSNNSLTSLNVSNNTALTSLTCNNNSLMTLDVSANMSLTDLYCNNNHLRSLNVKNGNNSNFTNFNATNNPDLTCIQIDVGDVDYLGSPWTNKDAGASYNEVCTVNIPDPYFKAALLANVSINTNSDGEIQYDEASAWTSAIDVSYQVISNLTGIEAFTNITDLYCDYNSLTSLDVSSNAALTTLYCRNNQLTSLNVSGATALTEIHCAYNQLDSLDISSNSALTMLGCSNNLLTSLDVSANPVLDLLHCQDNQLTNLDVTSNTSLTDLYCYNNSLTSLNLKNGNNEDVGLYIDATNNPDLYCIQVDNVDYSINNWSYDGNESFSTDCSCVVNIPDANFRNYLLGNTSINTNSDGIIDCTEAAAYTGAINVSSLGISDLTGIEAFTNITDLECWSNQLTSLDVSHNTTLTYLDCDDNLLTSLNVKNGNNFDFSGFDATNNPSLTCIQVDNAAYSIANWLNIDGLESFSEDCSCVVSIPDGNFLSALLDNGVDLNGDGEIQCFEAKEYTGTLDISSQSISDLTGIEVFTNITDLECWSNQLTSLDVSHNTALTYLDCDDNLLTSLDVHLNTALDYLDCDDNLLTSLVSSNTALEFLFCDNNQLTGLNVSANTALVRMTCANNQLSSLNVSSNTALYSLSCSSNSLTSLDVHLNTALNTLYCNNNSLTSLNVKNGNNFDFSGFDATNNPGLTCIQVDDAASCYSNPTWANGIDGLESFSSTACPPVVSWIGVISPDWSDGTNWSTGNKPTSADDVIINSGTSHDPIVDLDYTSPAVCNALTIAPTATLTVDAGKALTASGTTNNNGTITILSTSLASTGSFIDNGLAGAGTYNVEKFLTGAPTRFNYIGTPISGTFSTVFDLPTNELWSYSEPDHAWSSLILTGTALDVQQGYAARLTADKTVTFSGNGLTSGPITNTLTFNTPDPGNHEGYNLISNPYPSAIDIQGFTTSTSIEKTVWYRSGATFPTWNWSGSGTGANGGIRYIPAMQAFWVRANSDVPIPTIDFDNADRVHGTDPFFKTTVETNIFRMTASDGTFNDENVIGFYQDAQNAFENYDSRKMFGTDGPQLYSLTDDLVKVIINGQTEMTAGEERIVSLGFKTDVAGTFTLDATNLSDFDANISVYLEDIQQSVIQDLRQSNTYTFTSVITDNGNRFKIHFGDMITSVPTLTESAVSAYAVNNNLYVNTPKTATIKVYDVLGKLIMNQQSAQGLNKLQLNVETGIYIVNVQTGTQVTTQKVMISK